MLDWLIIGGGMHGTALSLALTKRDGIPRERLRVLDPHTEPLALWKRFTANVGMAYLRSPGVHHLHYDPFSIRTFQQTERGRPLYHSIPRFERPTLAFFNAYTDYLIDRFRLESLRMQGRALALRRRGDCWRVETDGGLIEAKNVLLAISTQEAPLIPAWARKIGASHIFAPDFSREAVPAGDVVIVGGGISAAQTALAFAEERPGAVTLVMRHAVRVHDFDSEPCWVVPTCLRDFHKVTDYAERRAMIRRVRYRGSMPYDIAERLHAAIQSGMIRRVQAQILDADSGSLHLEDGTHLPAAQVILCTGFESARPGGAWIDDLITAHDLPIAPDGYPILDKSLRWADGLYATGALAELEIGPVARNLIGARLAGFRVKRS